MNVTVLHRISSFTGSMTFGDGTTLNFINGQAGPLELSYGDIAALDYMGSGYRIITSDSPSPVYDSSADAVTAAIIGAPGSQTTAALRAAFALSDTLNLRRLNDLAASDRQRSAAAARTVYEDTTVFTESWANLTAWAGGTGLQVSAGAVYSNGGGGSTAGATRAWALGTTGTGRAVLVVNHASAAGSGGLVVGVSSDTAGSPPAAGAVNSKGLYFHPAAVIQSMDSGTATNLAVGVNPTSGTYIVTITADARYLSVVAVKSDGSAEYRTRFARGSFNIQCLYIFNSDSRNLTGDSVGALGARTGIGTITPRTGIEGTARTVQWTTLPSSVSCRIALPPTYDSRKPAPLAICFHGNGSDETHFADNANGLAVANALTAAGFIVASAGAGSTWGAQAALDAYYALYQYVRDTYAIGATVLYANSMGSIEALLSLAERRIPSVAAYAATSPTANLASVYTDGSASAVSEALALGAGEFTTTINTAYGITGTAPNDYATLTAGHDPLLKAGSAFRGVPVKMYAATDDYQVLKDKNADPLLALVAPFSPDATVTAMTGGHSTAQIASNATAIATWLAGYVAA